MWWRIIDDSDRRWVVNMARERGIKILINDKPKKRPLGPRLSTGCHHF